MPDIESDTLDLTALPFWQWDTMPVPETGTGLPLDSLLPTQPVADTVFRTSMFSHHTLQVEHDTLLPRPNNSQPLWTFIVVVLLVGVLCLYYHLRKIKALPLLRSLIDLRAMDRMVRECNLNRNTLLLPMGLLLTTSVCLAAHSAVLGSDSLLGFLSLSVIVAALYILRNGVFRLLGNALDRKAAVSLYITSNYLFHLAEATVVTILLLPMLYMPGAYTTVVWIILSFLAIAFIFRFSRGVKVFLTNTNGSSFYLFYYLCIVESIPVLAIIKWFIEH